MSSNSWKAVGAAVIAGIILCNLPTHSAHVEAAANKAEAKPVPVEEDMHEFMEYVFEPAFKRLKLAMAAAPADNAGWKILKGEGLVLAEGGNLTMLRAPAEETATWNAMSADVRDHGKGLYTAAKMKNFDEAKKSYVAMIHSCNACHDKFAGGEHQLEP